MPKSRFSKDAFKQANEASKGGDFGDIEKGIYVATIEKAKMQETTNGAYQACFGWQISNEDDRHPNAYVWWNQTLTNTNGKPNEIGLQQLNQAYYALSEGAFDPDDFQFDESGEVVNDEEVHEKFFGSIAKIQIIPKGEFNGQTQYQIRIKSIIENKYQGNGEVNSDTSSMVPGDSVELPDDHDDAEDSGPKLRKAYENAPVVYDDSGIQRLGRIISFVDDPDTDEFDPNGNGAVYIQPIKAGDKTFTIKHGKPKMVEQGKISIVTLDNEPPPPEADYILPKVGEVRAPSTIDAPIDEEVVEEKVLDDELEIPVLKKGMSVSYSWQGKTLKSTIYDIDEDAGIIKVIAINGNGQKVARKINLTNILPLD